MKKECQQRFNLNGGEFIGPEVKALYLKYGIEGKYIFIYILI